MTPASPAHRQTRFQTLLPKSHISLEFKHLSFQSKHLSCIQAPLSNQCNSPAFSHTSSTLFAEHFLSGGNHSSIHTPKLELPPPQQKLHIVLHKSVLSSGVFGALHKRSLINDISTGCSSWVPPAQCTTITNYYYCYCNYYYHYYQSYYYCY